MLVGQVSVFSQDHSHVYKEVYPLLHDYCIRLYNVNGCDITCRKFIVHVWYLLFKNCDFLRLVNGNQMSDVY